MNPESNLCAAVGEVLLHTHSVLDKDGRFRHFSDGVIASFGYGSSELTARLIHDFISPDDDATFAGQLAKALPGVTAALKPFRFRMRSGGWRWLEPTVTNMLQVPSVNGFLLICRDVTNQIEAEKNRKKITTSYSDFFAKHPFGVVHLTLAGEVDMINPKLTEDLGYRLIDITERSLPSFFLPKYRRLVLKKYCKASRYGEAETFDVEVFNARGRALHVNLTIIPVVHNGELIEVYAVIKDIEDRVKMQENLRKLSIVADKTTNGVVISDKNGLIEWVNNSFCQLNGYTLAETLGKRMSEVLRTGATNEQLKSLDQKLASGANYTKEILCRRKDGSAYWNLVEITPVMDRNGRLEKRISIHTDITERKKAEAELQQFAHDLFKRNKELQQFGYVVSHNLRSPVANIMGLANVLEIDQANPGIVQMCTSEIKHAVGRLDTIIRDLSAILSVTDGSRELTLCSLDIVDLIEDVKADLKEVITLSGTQIISPESPCIVFSHKAYLYSIFFNLIGNAIKYRSRNTPVIRIDLMRSEEFITISVSDNGLGIDLKKYQDDIFKPYKRFSSAVEGKGLGLFLVKGHVEALQGEINVKSRLGKGTTFIITLPIIEKLKNQQTEDNYRFS
ncbi:PAS domain S-box protein [Mucilaginibacter sp. RS28]|uniref:histidine kinase n=1 Tax=Mucilaginibacter straminoryzae TaxID=2932774 RepID=A0A9X1X3Q2_9SPHI|nr:PAS domain S-box protein [Mucilaginibacter straminoryzae]MCJ8209053.1 PAS domain S-box protein [Mucilaginibacter straminoryzae]